MQSGLLVVMQPGLLVITQSGVGLGLAVLAPLTQCLHFTRQPDGPAQPCWLSWLPHSVQRCEMPSPNRPQPAH